MGNRIKYILLISSFIFLSCKDELLKEEFQNSPLGNYDALWSEYDRTYGAFEAKNIKWDSLYNVYRSTLNENSSDNELYIALTGLLRELNDGHIQLTASDYKRFFSSGIRTLYPDSRYYNNRSIVDALFKVDEGNYLSTVKKDKSFFWSFVRKNKASKRIGYLRVPTFSYDQFKWNIVDQALDSFKTADAVIIDLRFNGGGATDTFLKLLNKLSDKKRRYLRSKLRSGPKHNDYTKTYDHFYEPKYGTFKEKPLIVLVNRFSGSSSEHFMLGIQTLPYGTVIGDTTYGALSTVLEKVLPNGWSFRTSPQVLCDSTGNFLRDSQGRYPDGVGLAPDVYVINYYADIQKGRDLVLEKAIEMIEIRLKHE